ncbi:sugar phosphate isomerase/epimerase family protein [Ruania alba]|uniref:Sugar phosphate isomerase/epimerase n=1 Tax=Ruania alba TaxID=648782 RepID=A0A1H5HLL4_9MICO|nr:sugar phosphate isomerase/epimerase [Ruania alba]SEE28561.1 Sugar phosphate isomerase/epimerase [Ruania alba]
MTHLPAIQLYTVREAMAEDRASTLRQLADMGYGAIEVHRPTDDPAGLRALIEDLGLKVCAAHAGDAVGNPEPGPVFEAIASLGTDLAVVPGGRPKEDRSTRDGIERIADEVNRLLPYAQAAGLRLGYHNHDHELTRIDGQYALDRLLDQVDDEMFLEVDTYWAAAGGADVLELLGRYGDRVKVLHLKDGPGVRGPANVALGEGSLAVAEYVAAAPYAWRVVEFDKCETDIFDAVARSHDYLARLAS